jgi:hypothetical protein
MPGAEHRAGCNSNNVQPEKLFDRHYRIPNRARIPVLTVAIKGELVERSGSLLRIY